MTEPLSEESWVCCGCAAGAVLGLLLGSLLAVMIVSATTKLPERPPAAGYSLINFDGAVPIVGGACFGGFFGLVLGSISGVILGRWVASKSAGGRKAIDEGRKGTIQDNRAEPDAPPDGPRDERFFER